MSLLGYRHAHRQALVLLLGVVLTLSGLVAVASTARAATDPCGAGGNAIACENSKPGSPPSEWDIDGAGDDSIQGFATDISVDAGSRIDFKIDTDASAYSITIYRIGYYGGDGARRITTVDPSATLPQIQPNCIQDASTELTDCGNWAVSASWQVPSTAVSGVYIAKLTRPDLNDSSHIIFVVRNDVSHSDVVFQTSDPTWEAYNLYGGSNFYHGAANGRSYKISYNRPFATRNGTGGRDFFFSNEYPMVRYLERNGYDVSYLTGVDSDRFGSLLLNHKVFLSVGHDEYWSKAQRANVEAARDAGVNLQFLSGNEVYWKTRYEPSADASQTPYRTLVSYKETWSNAKTDPSDEWTGTWRDPRFAPTSKGAGRPENGLTGTAYMSNYSDLPVTVSAAEGKLRLWRDTTLAGMTSGTEALAPHTVGYESDEDLLNSSRPGGLIRLSTTTGDVPEYLQDFGNVTAPDTTTHHLTMYRAPSGALVFSAGSVQWTWGLDGEHDSAFAPEPADVRMQQAEANLLADMGAQPTTLMSGLHAPSASTDATGPTVSIATPAPGATVANGTVVTVTGTASDTGGGVVAGVEFSTDGGTTWKPATGTTSWTLNYRQHGSGTTPLQVRGIDDSSNIGTAAIRSLAVTCPCSIFGDETPATPAANDAGGVELGLRFTATSDGYVSGIRFYKGTGNTGTHTGTLWSTTGTKLASVAFSNETAGGWQTASFSSVVPVIAGQTYVASYTAPAGHYAVQSYAFTSEPLDAPPFLVDGGFGAAPAGVYGGPGAFPTRSFKNANYYVDVVFTSTDDSPLGVMSPWPSAGATSVSRTTTVSARFSKPVVTGSVGLALKYENGVAVPGTTAYDAATRTVTFTPTNPLSGFVVFTATVTGTDTLGGSVASGGTWSFRTATPPAAPGVCPCSTLDEDTLPAVVEDKEHADLTLGVRFTSEKAGTVTGVRFYKAAGNTGPHVGTLWSANATVLAQGTFTAESPSGWQTLTFAQPVPIQANTQYVASYHTTGFYSDTPNAFASADLSRPPLHVSSAAGAYAYGSGFPSSASPSSYLVDLVFEKAPPTIAVTTQQPAPGALGVPRGTPVTIGFTAPITTGWSMSVKQGSTPIAGSAALNGAGDALTFTPSAKLPADTDVSVTVSGVVSVDGAALPAQSWTFHTRSIETPSAQTLFGDVVPSVWSTADASPTEVGTAFVPAQNGRITALRFFKDAGNGGTHVGSLWSSTGTLLGRVTFTDETASGWQQATLPTPVDVVGGTRYVVSYLAPQGHYSSTPAFFTSPWTSGDLTAPTTNGRYVYGAAGGFPTSSFNATNYFADVVFERSSTVTLLGAETPVTQAVSDVTPVEVGTAFSTSVAGSVTAIRFYKGAANTGTHVGSLWSSTGTRLASVTFTGETDSGWQKAKLSTPVPLTVGQTYVVSYFAPNGRFAQTSNYFAAAKTSRPLTAPATANGRYVYGASGGFPTSSFKATNYFVDVEFTPAPTP